MQNSYIALFEFVSAPTLYATIYASDFDAACEKQRELASQHGCHSHSLAILADNKDINPRALELIADLKADQYLGQFEADARPPRIEAVVELAQGQDTLPAMQYLRQTLLRAGWTPISIREI